MKSILLFLIILFSFQITSSKTSCLCNQSTPNKTDTIPFDLLYELPAFKNGTVYLKDGTTNSFMLNYNCYRNEMDLLTEKGDTFMITEPELIDKIVIDTMVYRYDKGFVREIKICQQYKLAVRRETAFNLKSGGGSVHWGNESFIKMKGDYKAKLNFYIGDRYNHFVTANKKGFLWLFAEKKRNLALYIKDNNIDLKKEDDIYKLFEYCTR